MGNTADPVEVDGGYVDGVIFSMLKDTDPHTVRGRPALKKMACVMTIYFETGRSVNSK